MIHVTRTYLPEKEKYYACLNEIWKTGWLTNNGPMVLKLEDRLKEYLNIKNLHYCNNGTIALQIALKALNISKEVITTPFSYVATTNVILWENCTPVFVDINDNDFNIDAKKIESQITENTEAILATHVFGNPCDVHEIERIAKKNNLKVVYDAAHAFGVRYNNESLFSHGDISTCSFHATKIFHTVEGGAIICKDHDVNRKAYLMRQFGHLYDDYFSVGINGKASDIHAAMGLCVLDDMHHIRERRKWATMYYNERLNFSKLQAPAALPGTDYNYAYYPVVFSDEKTLLKVSGALNREGIFPRRYFYPSLNNLAFLPRHSASPVSESISSRIACLPLSTYLVEEELDKIIFITNNNL